MVFTSSHDLSTLPLNSGRKNSEISLLRQKGTGKKNQRVEERTSSHKFVEKPLPTLSLGELVQTLEEMETLSINRVFKNGAKGGGVIHF